MSARRSRVVFTRASPAPYGAIDPQRPARRSTKLTISQEQTVIEDVFDLDRRGYALQISDIESIASSVRVIAYLQKTEKFLARNLDVGRKWAEDFVDRTPELKACLERNKAYHQDTTKGLELAPRWFKLVQETKAKYGISDNNVFTLGETRFLIDPLSIAIVTTPTQHQQRPKTRGQEHYRWATVLQAIGASGQVMPPMVIFKDERFLPSWYTDETPRDWLIDNSSDGCNTLQMLGDWKSVFNSCTRQHEAETWRLLIQNSCKAGFAADWNMCCESSKIVTLCVPPGLSHLLQPLELGCLLPLKAAYEEHVKTLRRHRTTSMTDNEFLATLKDSLTLALTPENIVAGFRSSGLVPFDPSAVLPQSVTLEGVTSWDAPKAPSPPAEAYELMIFCGSEFREIKAQILALKDRERKRRKQRASLKKKNMELIAVGETSGLMTKKEGSVQEEEEKVGQPAKRVRAERHCGRCGEVGHNSRTCKVEIVDAVDSDESEE